MRSSSREPIHFNGGDLALLQMQDRIYEDSARKHQTIDSGRDTVSDVARPVPIVSRLVRDKTEAGFLGQGGS